MDEATGVEREEEGPESGGVGLLGPAWEEVVVVVVGGPRIVLGAVPGPRMGVAAAAEGPVLPPRAPAAPPPRGPRPLPLAPDMVLCRGVGFAMW